MRKLFIALFVLVASASWADGSLTVFNKDLLTLEYSDKSAFAFIDITPTFKYGEITLNSGGKLFFSSNTEFGDITTRHLMGVGIRLDAPGIDYMQLIQYRRSDELWQTTLVAGTHYKRLILDGFVDRTDVFTSYAAQLKFKISDNLLIGCEWSNLNKERVSAFIQGRF